MMKVVSALVAALVLGVPGVWLFARYDVDSRVVQLSERLDEATRQRGVGAVDAGAIRDRITAFAGELGLQVFPDALHVELRAARPGDPGLPKAARIAMDIAGKMRGHNAEGTLVTIHARVWGKKWFLGRTQDLERVVFLPGAMNDRGNADAVAAPAGGPAGFKAPDMAPSMPEMPR